MTSFPQVLFHQTKEAMATRHKTVVSISKNTLELSSSLAVLEKISARTVGRPQCPLVIPNSSQKNALR